MGGQGGNALILAGIEKDIADYAGNALSQGIGGQPVLEVIAWIFGREQIKDLDIDTDLVADIGQAACCNIVQAGGLGHLLQLADGWWPCALILDERLGFLRGMRTRPLETSASSRKISTCSASLSAFC